MSERMTDERARDVDEGVTAAGWEGVLGFAAEIRADWLRARAEEARLLEMVKRQEERLRAFTLAAMPLARFVEAFSRQPICDMRVSDIVYGIHGGDACWPVGADVKLSDLEALAAAYAKAVST